MLTSVIGLQLGDRGAQFQGNVPLNFIRNANCTLRLTECNTIYIRKYVAFHTSFVLDLTYSGPAIIQVVHNALLNTVSHVPTTAVLEWGIIASAAYQNLPNFAKTCNQACNK
jgi:hypothetical protein